MTWDFPEINPFSGAAGDPLQSFTSLEKIIRRLPAAVPTIISQQDARSASIAGGGTAAICTDPPYYDNIGYADLSDFFYVWIRRALAHVYPQELTTLLTPKTEELIASPNRHAGGAKAAKSYFEKGLGETLNNFAKIADSSIPVTIFYAFKQSEITSEGQASTGWETFLAAVLGAGFSIVGTWPVRTERDQGLKTGTNVLASSIVLVCRLRAETAERVSRREFRAALKAELPDALRLLQQSNIAPVDLAQAAIGPGIGVFSRYLEVLEQDGSRMSVRTSLGIINEVLDEVLTEQEGEFDNDTRFALKWFEQYAHDQGSFGDANTLANALAIGINGLQEAGIVVAQSGKVKLIARDDLASDWTPASDVRLTLWECVQQLIRRLEVDGESGAAELLHEIVRVRGSDYGECARDLAYRLYSTCERKSWPAEALSYNGLVVSWPEIAKLAREMKSSGPTATQQEMFDS
jgi:putative DNA methylase